MFNGVKKPDKFLIFYFRYSFLKKKKAEEKRKYYYDAIIAATCELYHIYLLFTIDEFTSPLDVHVTSRF